jgi:phage FluMu protein Com
MGWRSWFGLEPVTEQPKVVSIRFPLNKEVARDITGFNFQRTFKCSCVNEFTENPTQITIRTRTDRSDGPSNFLSYPDGHKQVGHSQVDSDLLSWNGLLEERGWDSSPVKCPACKAGVDLKTYKESRR